MICGRDKCKSEDHTSQSEKERTKEYLKGCSGLFLRSILGAVIILVMFLTITETARADYFNDLNRMISRESSPSWKYEITQQDEDFDIESLEIIEEENNLVFDYHVKPKTSELDSLKNVPVKKNEKLLWFISMDKTLATADLSNNTGTFTIEKPKENSFLLHIGEESAIVNVTFDVSTSLLTMYDVFIYDITKDSLNYTTWYNESSMSWYNHTKGNRLPEYSLVWTNNTGTNCQNNLLRLSDMNPSSYWQCATTGGTASVYFDMGKDYSFDQATLLNHASITCALLNISSSSDNITWTQRGGKTTVVSNNYFNVEPFTDRYVMFNFSGCPATIYVYSLALYDSSDSGTFPTVSDVIMTSGFIDIVDAQTNALWKRLSHDTTNDVLGSINVQNNLDGIYAYDGTLYFGAGLGGAVSNKALTRISFSNDSQAWSRGDKRYCFRLYAGLTCDTYSTNFSEFHKSNSYEDEGAYFNDMSFWNGVDIYSNIARNITVKKKVPYGEITAVASSSTGGYDGSKLADNGVGSARNFWLTVAGVISNVWLHFDLGAEYNLSAISLRNAAHGYYYTSNPATLYLYGSIDDVNWDLLGYYDIPQDERYYGGYNIRFDNSIKYRYFNMTIPTSYGASSIGLGEVEFYQANETENQVLHIIGESGHTLWRKDDFGSWIESTFADDTFFGYNSISGKYLALSDDGKLIIGDEYGIYLISELYSGKQSYVTRTVSLANINDINFLDNDTFIVSAGTEHRIYDFDTGTETKSYGYSGADYNIIKGTSTIMNGNSPVNSKEAYVGSKGKSTGSMNKVYTLANSVLDYKNSDDATDLDITDVYALRTVNNPDYYWIDYVIYGTSAGAFAYNVTSIPRPDATDPLINSVAWSESTIYDTTTVFCNITAYDDTSMTLNYSFRVNNTELISVNNTVIYNNYSFLSMVFGEGNFTAGDTIGCYAIVSDVEGNTASYQANTTVSGSPPGSCTLTFPSNNTQQTNSPLALDWSDSSSAATYYVYGDNETGTTLLGTSSTSDKIWHDLISGKTYYWKVIASNSAGNTSCSSENVFQFSMVVPGLTDDQDRYLRGIYNWSNLTYSLADYINTTISNTVVIYLQEINSTTHTAYSYLTDTIYPMVNDANSTIYEVLAKWGSYNASTMYNKINDTYNKASDSYTDTQELLAKWGTYNAAQVYNLSNITYWRTVDIYSDMATDSALQEVNSTVTDIKNNWGAYTAVDIITGIDAINITVNDIQNKVDCSNQANSELCTYLGDINTTVGYIKANMATASSLATMQANVTWLINNVATQGNVTLLSQKLDTINSTANAIKTQTGCSNSSLNNLTSSDYALCSYLYEISSNVSDLKNNWGDYTAGDVITRLIEINTTAQDTSNFLTNDILRRFDSVDGNLTEIDSYLSDMIYTKLNLTWNNTQQTLAYIGNPNDDESQNTLFGEHVYTQNRILEINSNLTYLKTLTEHINMTTEAVNSTVSTILLEVDNLEELHQCSISPNSTICTLLNSLKADTGNILTLTAEINQTTSSMSLFSISSLIAGSPRYADETAIIEAVFTGQNNSYANPDTINLTIWYPDYLSTWATATKSDFTEGSGHIWKYSKPISGNPTTGMYFVHMLASYKGIETSKSAQFRIATGGPYKVYLECPDSGYVGQNLVCDVILEDEGEAPTESTSTVWVDIDDNGVLDSGETQVSFSKQTVPLQNVTQSVSINVPSSNPTGLYVVRVDTSYASSSQPNSGASDSVVFSLPTGDNGGNNGGGTGGGTSNGTEEVPTAPITEEAIAKAPHLFDSLLVIPNEYSKVNPGDFVLGEITIYNLGAEKMLEALLEYSVINPEGEIIINYTETVVIYAKVQLIKKIYLPSDMPEGDYFFNIEVKYNNKSTASKSRFNVFIKEGEKEKIEMPSTITVSSSPVKVPYWLWILVSLAVLLIAYVSVGYKPKKEHLYKQKKDIWRKRYKIDWKPIINVFVIILLLSGIVLGSYFGFNFVKNQIAQIPVKTIPTIEQEIPEPRIIEQSGIPAIEKPSQDYYPVVQDPLFRNMIFIAFVVIMIIILVRGINLRGNISFGKGEQSGFPKEKVSFMPFIKEKPDYKKIVKNTGAPEKEKIRMVWPIKKETRHKLGEIRFPIKGFKNYFPKRSKTPKNLQSKEHIKESAGRTRDDEIKTLESYGFKVNRNKIKQRKENEYSIKIEPGRIKKDISRKKIKFMYNIIQKEEKLLKKEEAVIQKDISKRGRMLNELKGVFNG